MRTDDRCFAVWAALCAVMCVAGCDASDGAEPDGAPPIVDGDVPDVGADAQPDAGPMVEDDGCDPLQPEVCTYPWPSNRYLVADADRASGYRLEFPPGVLPASVTAGPIDPAPWSRMDGYGLGTPIMAHFPDVDPSQMPDETRIGDSMAADAAALLFQVTDDGLRRVHYYVDLDAQAPAGAARTVIMRPAEVLHPDTRYVVAFRGLRTAGGDAIMPSAAFASLVAGGAEDPLLAARQDGFDEMFGWLEAEGIERTSLTLAWSFRTASEEALTGPLRHMVTDALSVVGDEGPELIVDEVDRYSPDPENAEGLEYNPYVAYRIKGHFRAPHYMKLDSVFEGKQGYVFNRGDDGMPAQDGWREDVRFYATIPYGALDGTPHGLINHGHGMFGDAKDAADLGWTRDCGKYPPRECGWFHGRVDENHQFITYAVDLVGMSDFDRDEYALTVLTDITRFTWLADRLHQGLTEYVLITRAMINRFAALPEVAELGVQLAEGESYYWGISQGAIFGPTFLSLTPDVDRGVLGVAGNNYATLLERSRNFAPFFGILSGVYPQRDDQLVIIALMQLLWDGTDSISYVRRLHTPFEGQTRKDVLIDVAVGDYQVTPLTIENLARSDLGLPLMANYDDQRTIPAAEVVDYPHTGSGITNWHFGNAWPPPGNVPPEEDAENGDPHENARHMDTQNAQMAHFFRTGEIIDVCNGGVCPDLSEVMLDDPAE